MIPAMEAVFEFGKAALRVFWPEGMYSGYARPVAEHGIDPVELRLLYRGPSAATDYNRMPASGLSDAVEALQTVGNDLAAGH